MNAKLYVFAIVLIAMNCATLCAEEVKNIITKENAKIIIYRPPLTWSVHSIGIAYDIDNTQNILFSSQQLNNDENVSNENNNSEFKNGSNMEISKGLAVNTRTKVDSSWAPMPFLSAKGLFALETSIAVKDGYVSSKSFLMSKQNQKLLSQRQEQMTKTLSDTKITKCHLTFAISFKNNTDKDLIFSSSSTVPVYEKDELILEAVPDSVSNNNIQRIPSAGIATIKFRGEMNTTKALDLVNSITNNTITIHPEQGQLFIHSEDGTVKNAIQLATSGENISISCNEYKWQIKKNLDQKKTTLREALWAVNSTCKTPLFDIGDDGLFNHISLDLESLPVLKKGNGYCLCVFLNEKDMNIAIPENGVEFLFVDFFDVLANPTVDPKLTECLQEALLKWESGENNNTKFIRGDSSLCGKELRRAIEEYAFQDLKKRIKNCDYYSLNRQLLDINKSMILTENQQTSLINDIKTKKTQYYLDKIKSVRDIDNLVELIDQCNQDSIYDKSKIYNKLNVKIRELTKDQDGVANIQLLDDQLHKKNKSLPQLEQGIFEVVKDDFDKKWEKISDDFRMSDDNNENPQSYPIKTDCDNLQNLCDAILDTQSEYIKQQPLYNIAHKYNEWLTKKAKVTISEIKVKANPIGSANYTCCYGILSIDTDVTKNELKPKDNFTINNDEHSITTDDKTFKCFPWEGVYIKFVFSWGSGKWFDILRSGTDSLVFGIEAGKSKDVKIFGKWVNPQTKQDQPGLYTVDFPYGVMIYTIVYRVDGKSWGELQKEIKTIKQ